MAYEYLRKEELYLVFNSRRIVRGITTYFAFSAPESHALLA